MYTTTLHESNDDIAQLVAQSHRLSKNSIFPFADCREFLTELFIQHDCEGIHLLSVGTATPDIAIAADKANMSIKEIQGKNPFSYSVETILKQITNGDIVYLANPNKITGANFSLTGRKKIAESNPDGLIIIDEYYFDFYGITGLTLINEFENVLILRSFTAAFGIYSSEAGYALSTLKIIQRCKEMAPLRQISTILRKTILATMSNEDASQGRIHDIREEALRLTEALTSIGLQCRITATDFLLIRVASTKDVGNFLMKNKVSVDNISGYPEMKNYIRFRIESFLSNDRLIKAFDSMPNSLFQMKTIEKRKITLRRPLGENVETQKSHDKVDALLNGKIKERSHSIKAEDNKREKVAE